MANSTPVKGSCLCGQVTLTINSFERDVVACHCQQCRKQTGTHVSAANVKDSQLTVAGEQHIKWYAASSFASRGFCSHCGSLLFWKHKDSDATAVMAGSLESPTGLSLIKHIFVSDKGDYYSIDDGLPQFAQSD